MTANSEAPAMRATATIATAHASKYLVQLSKHWSHRFPALTYSPERADIPLPMGPVVLEARADALEATVSANDAEGLARAEKVLDEHLRRFAFREDLAIEWSREGA